MIEFATALGRHPGAAFAGFLAAALVLALAGWRLAGALASRPAGESAPTPGMVLRFYLAAGLPLALVAALVFALLAPALGPEAAVGAFDRALAGSLRHGASRATLEVFAAVTCLADPAILWGLGLGVCALRLLRRAWLPAVGWAVALAGHGLVNPALKAIFERPRPFFAHDLVSGVDGFAFPSGHAAGAMAAYGMLAWLLLHAVAPAWRLPVVLVAASLIAAVGYSRVVLQVHYLSDVLAGYAWAAAWVAICIAATEAARARSRLRRAAGEGLCAR